MYQKFGKRFLDIMCAFIGLIILSPLFLIIYILVLIFLGFPGFFKQERIGKDEKKIRLYKFRTMTNAKDKSGRLLSDEKRLTKFGRFLRSTSIDELPELFNILKGDMSFVGPRPLLVKYLPFYREEEIHRHDVKPGLTGLAQVSGRNDLNWDDRFKKDIEYVKKIKFSIDVKIILLTIRKVLKREDVQMGNGMRMEDLDIERTGHENKVFRANYQFFKAHKKEILSLVSNLSKGHKDSKRILNNMGIYLNDNSAIILCYLDGGVVEGILWAFHINKRRLHINYFVVDSEYRNKGVGTLLLQKIISIDNHSDCFELLVDRVNKKAIDFYKRNGFVKDDTYINDDKYKMILKRRKAKQNEFRSN